MQRQAHSGGTITPRPAISKRDSENSTNLTVAVNALPVRNSKSVFEVRCAFKTMLQDIPVEDVLNELEDNALNMGDGGIIPSKDGKEHSWLLLPEQARRVRHLRHYSNVTLEIINRDRRERVRDYMRLTVEPPEK